MKTKNVYEDDDISQEGGTGILAFDTIIGWVSESGADINGMGRWCWINLKENN